MFIIIVVVVVVYVYLCVFLYDIYKCGWNIVFIGKDLLVGVRVFRLFIVFELYVENFIMKFENYRSINIVVFVY